MPVGLFLIPTRNANTGRQGVLMKHVARSLLLATSLIVSTPAIAATAIESFTGGTQFDAVTSDETIGFTFNALENLRVFRLGWFGPNGQLASSHQIGIWNSTGGLVGSATVTPGTVDSSGFRYVDITPIILLGGQQYFIGGRDTIGDGDSYVTGVSDFVTSPSVQYLARARSGIGQGFAFPGLTDTATIGRFGPNFQFSVTAAVPEPATWALMLLGFFGVGMAVRRQRQAVTVSYA
ncbi:PEPxxWA-CTERM sorting domain-containing protein [Leptolyngbya sp. 15MV]|nr:PEPxxWA-CTERM sorting domain-containing protein [Leptolyngbya sp. 15MV]